MVSGFFHAEKPIRFWLMGKRIPARPHHHTNIRISESFTVMFDRLSGVQKTIRKPHNRDIGASFPGF